MSIFEAHYGIDLTPPVEGTPSKRSACIVRKPGAQNPTLPSVRSTHRKSLKARAFWGLLSSLSGNQYS